MRIILCIMFTTMSVISFAQKAEEVAIKQVVQKLFTAMQQGDTAAARSCFEVTARLQTALINPSTEKTTLDAQTIDDFIRAVNRIGKSGQKIEERIIKYDIKVDVPLASVWATYQFYVNEQFSHKGVDAFQFFKTVDGWKIIQICDTRKK